MMKSLDFACFYMFIVLKSRELIMGLKIDNSNIIIEQIREAQAGSAGNANSSQSGNVSLFQNKDDAIKQLCAQLQISEEQLKVLIDKYPDFYSLEPAKQSELVKNSFATEAVDSTPDTDNTNVSETVSVSKNNVSNSETADSTKVTAEIVFNHKEFSRMSVQDKANIYALELAKNKFLYPQDGSEKSIEDWNSLSEEQRNNLVKNELNALIKDNSKKLYDKKDINTYFDNKMLKLQTANYLEQNIDNFDKQDGKYIATSIHDYLFNLDSEKLSKKQNDYLKQQYILSKAVIQACKDKGDTTYLDNVEYNLAEDEIAEKFDKNGILNGTTRIEVQMKYLQDKIDKGIELDASEKAVYKRLNKLVNSDEGRAFLDAVKYKSTHPDEQVNYGRLDALKNSEFGKDFEAAVNKEDKAFVVQAYLKKASANLSSKEKAKLINELTIELMYDADNTDMIVDVHSDAVANADDKTQTVLAENKEEGLAELNTLNANSFEENGLSTLANTHEKMIEEDAERAEMLASGTMDNLGNKKLEIVSGIYSSSKSETIQRKHAEIALGLEIKSDEDVKTQRALLENVNKNSNLEVRKDTGKRLDEAHKDNQLPLTEQFIKDKEVAKAMNADGTFTRYDKDNKTDAFRMFRTRFEQDDFMKDEAVNQLNLLSDNIKKVKEADIQLEMHNDIMQSKYSEVQEHAAANIKDYDPTVQGKALETVYETGNAKAIDTSVESIANTRSDSVIEQNFQKVITRAVVNTIDNNTGILDTIDLALDGLSLQKKVSSGAKLTVQEYASLTPAQKKEYIENLFKALSPDEKIKLLKSISNSSQKRNIYKMIARTNTDLLNRLITDPNIAKTIKDMNISGSVNNKIDALAERKQHSEIQWANFVADENKNDNSNFDYPPRTANTVGFSSIPQNLQNIEQSFLRKGKQFEFNA